MTTERILTDLTTVCAELSKTIAEIVKDKRESNAPDDFKFIPLFAILDFIKRVRDIDAMDAALNKAAQPIKKFLVIEDGSVDTDELIKDLELKNPEIKVVVFRQGAMQPQLIDNKQ